MLEVLPLGSRVSLGDGTIPAIVTAIIIRGDRPSYEVVWWDGRARKSEWLETSEVKSDEVARTKIGFRQIG
ncbi:MAG: hypothetical protein ACXWNW_14170 [Isosphaeraceae bacterium]